MLLFATSVVRIINGAKVFKFIITFNIVRLFFSDNQSDASTNQTQKDCN